MPQCSFSIRALNFDNFDNSHISFLWPEYFIDYLCERWIPCQASTSVLWLYYRPVRVHCSTEDAYTSEITFLALNPWDLGPFAVLGILLHWAFFNILGFLWHWAFCNIGNFVSFGVLFLAVFCYWAFCTHSVWSNRIKHFWS